MCITTYMYFNMYPNICVLICMCTYICFFLCVCLYKYTHIEVIGSEVVHNSSQIRRLWININLDLSHFYIYLNNLHYFKYNHIIYYYLYCSGVDMHDCTYTLSKQCFSSIYSHRTSIHTEVVFQTNIHYLGISVWADLSTRSHKNSCR